jgi:hypothetical protein
MAVNHSRPEASELQPTEIVTVGASDESAKPVFDDGIEYDRRGVALPPRAKVGGIITPQ